VYRRAPTLEAVIFQGLSASVAGPAVHAPSRVLAGHSGRQPSAGLVSTGALEVWFVVVISLPLNRTAVQADRRSQEEDAAERRITGEGGE
jgi:hypothetical protein